MRKFTAGLVFLFAALGGCGGHDMAEPLAPPVNAATSSSLQTIHDNVRNVRNDVRDSNSISNDIYNDIQNIRDSITGIHIEVHEDSNIDSYKKLQKDIRSLTQDIRQHIDNDEDKHDLRNNIHRSLDYIDGYVSDVSISYENGRFHISYDGKIDADGLHLWDWDYWLRNTENTRTDLRSIVGMEIQNIAPVIAQEIFNNAAMLDDDDNYLVAKTTGAWDHDALPSLKARALDSIVGGQGRSKSVDEYTYKPAHTSYQYNYVEAYQLVPKQLSETESYHSGILGIAANTDTMPSGPQSPTVTYNGEAIGSSVHFYTNGRFHTDNDTATSRLTANFSNNTANLSIEANIGDISVDKMQINGNSFSGGTFHLDNQIYNNLDYTGISSHASGGFYGDNKNNGAPSEVGGIVASKGDTLGFNYIFLAKQ